MKKIIVVFGVCFCIIGIVKAQVSKTVNVNAGGLYSALTANQRDSVTNLTLTGTIDARDFVTMRDNLPYLAILDLSNVDIAAYSGKLGTYYTNDSTASYLANTIPQFAFLKTHINNDYPMLYLKNFTLTFYYKALNEQKWICLYNDKYKQNGVVYWCYK